MKKKNLLIPTMILGTAIIGISSGKAFGAAADGPIDPHNPDQEAIIDPIASYQFDDESNIGKDSMGNFNLTKVGTGTISVDNGVATFDGASALYNTDLLNAIGSSDFTVKATVRMSGNSTYAISMFNTNWGTGQGVGVQNWGGQLRAGLDDGANKFGEDHCWSLEMASNSSTEHTIVLSVKVGGKANFYCDGDLKGTADVSSSFDCSTEDAYFTLGGAYWTELQFGMTGTLSDVKIWKAAANDLGVYTAYKYDNLFKADVGDQVAISPLAKYEFKDSENPGKDTQGNFDLTKVGTVTASGGVAAFDGDGGLYSDTINNAIGGNDITVKMTLTLAKHPVNDQGYNALYMWKSYWAAGTGISIQNWGGQLRAGLDDGTNKFGSDHCWSLELASDSTVEHTVVLSIKVGGNANYYCDGQLIGTAAISNDFTFANYDIPFALGAGIWDGKLEDHPMVGTLKDVRIYTKAFSTRQVAELFDLNDVFESSKTTVESVDVLDYSSTIIVPDDATEAEIIAGYAPVGKQDITVHMDNGVDKVAKVQWTGVEEIEENLYLKGTLFDVLNENEVYAYAKIATKSNCAEILPVARYDFTSTETIGKDTMGNYDLTVSKKSDSADVKAEEGVAIFDGNYSLYNSKLASDLGAKATISFDVKLDGNVSNWCSPFSFGRDDWNVPTQWNLFEVEAGTTRLRYGACTEIDETTGHSNIDYTPNSGETNTDWYPVIGVLGTELNNITLTVGDNGHLKVYFNNALTYDHVLPNDFSLVVNKGAFTIGGVQPLGLHFTGKISNVVVYNFPATAEQVRIINATKNIKDNAYSDAFVVSYGNPSFEGEAVVTSEVKASDTKPQMLAKVASATVAANMSDETTRTLDVTWGSVVEEDGKYYAVGSVDVRSLQYAQVPSEIRVEIPVTQPFAISTGEVANGTVEVDKEAAYAEDTVTVTVTPSTGYEVDKVMVNDVELVADQGVYSFVPTEDSVVTATFKKVLYTISIAETSNGTVEADKETANYGDVVTLTITPAEGYEIDLVKVDEETITEKEGAYTFEVKGNSTVTVTFKAVQVTPVDPEPTEPEEKKGCSGSVVSASIIVSCLSLAGAGLIARKRKED